MVDYDKLHALRIKDLEETGGSARDGLTVRDYFAAKAMSAIVKNMYDEGMYIGDLGNDPIIEQTALSSYKMADAMMEVRSGKKTKPCSVEEAFGLPQ